MPKQGRIVEFARRALPVTLLVIVEMTFVFWLFYSAAQGDYSSVCQGPPIYPRCVADLNRANQIEVVVGACVFLMASGAVFGRKIRGVFSLVSLVVSLAMILYFLSWLV